MRKLNRRPRASGLDSRYRRDRLARTRELRRTLRFGSGFVAVVCLVTGFVLAARFSANASLLLVLWVSGAAASTGLFLTAGRASHRAVVPLTVLLTLIPATGLLVTAIEPRALLAMASGFTMLPVAVPLFLAWPRTLRSGWLVAYTLVFGGVTLATGLGHLDDVQRIDLASNVVIGAIIGWIGGELVERLRERTLGQEIELRRLNRELLVRATTDALTGLSNRRQLDTDLQMLSTPRLSVGPSCAFIMLDLDHFKRLNDELGHAVGDAALRSVSAELRRVVRGRDTIYRYGGEEFLVIMPNASLPAAREAAERIRGAIVDLHIKAGVASDAPSLTISCGVAFSLIAREQWETVLAAADSALYEAKATGRNRVCVMPDPVGEDAPTLARDRRRTGRRTPPTPARTAAPIEPDVDGAAAVA